MPNNTCLQCGKPVKGRADKKFAAFPAKTITIMSENHTLNQR
jgi:hypothetical protein